MSRPAHVFRLAWREPAPDWNLASAWSTGVFSSESPASIVRAASAAESRAIEAEFRISRHEAGALPRPVYTDLLRLERWRPGAEALPGAAPRSLWLEDVRRSARILKAGNGLQEALLAAVAGGLLSEIESAFLGEAMSAIIARCHCPSSATEFPRRPFGPLA